MKKAVFLLLGGMMTAGGLLVSCQKKENSQPKKSMGHCHQCKPSPPENPSGPCKRY